MHPFISKYSSFDTGEKQGTKTTVKFIYKHIHILYYADIQHCVFNIILFLQVIHIKKNLYQ